jgi:hypothetical protein
MKVSSAGLNEASFARYLLPASAAKLLVRLRRQTTYENWTPPNTRNFTTVYEPTGPRSR